MVARHGRWHGDCSTHARGQPQQAKREMRRRHARLRMTRSVSGEESRLPAHTAREPQRRPRESVECRGGCGTSIYGCNANALSRQPSANVGRQVVDIEALLNGFQAYILIAGPVHRPDLDQARRCKVLNGAAREDRFTPIQHRRSR